MFYEGTDKKIEWTGRMEQNEGRAILVVEREHLALGTGGIVPENWQGRRVRLTVELLEETTN